MVWASIEDYKWSPYDYKFKEYEKGDTGKDLDGLYVRRIYENPYLGDI